MSTVLKFPSQPVNEPQQEASQPQQVARMEDGFTRIPNALLEAIALHDLTKRQFKVLLIVARQTLGHGKSMDWVSGSQLEAKTGLPETRARAVVRELVAKSILVKEGRYIGVNMDISEWKKDQYRNSPVRTKTVPKNRTETVSKEVPKQSPTKETLQKKEEINPTSETADAVARPVADSQAETHATKPEGDQASSTKVSKYPACPQQAILDAWAEILPDRVQPKRNIWMESANSRNLANRWKQGFTIDHSSEPRKLYHDTESGIAFWRAVFAMCARSEFLMRDDSRRWFTLAWVAKKENFLKLLDRDFYQG